MQSPNLSSAQKSFLIAKQLSASKRLDDWIAFFAPVAEYDSQGDRVRARLRKWGLVCIVLGVLGGIFLLPLLLLIPGVYMLIKRARMAKEDLPPSLQGFVMPLLTLMREEVPAESEVRLELDLRGYERPDKQLPYKGPSRGNVLFYRDDWAAGAFPLADGSRVEWKATDFVRTSKLTKRSASGKYKTKRKVKLVRTYSVGLRALAANYLVSKTLSTQAGDGGQVRGKVREGEKRNLIRITSKQPPFTSFVDPSYEDLVNTVTKAYGMLSAPQERRPA
jgi:hypothetical protein